MYSASIAVLRALLLIFIFGCGDPPTAVGPHEIVLGLITADGLKPGDKVLQGQKEVGHIRRIAPSFDQVDAVVRFEKGVRPSESARFVLERREDGGRIIRILDERPSPAKMISGRKVRADIPVETLEDRMWVAK